MWRRGTYRIVIAFALAAALLATTAPLAAQPNGPAPAAAAWRLDWDALWTWAGLWLGLPASEAQKATCEAGSSIDPNGHTVCGPPASASSDAGGSIDPNGLKTSSSSSGTSSDAGAHIDPNG